MEMVPSSHVLPTLIKDVGKSSKLSAWLACGESWENGSCMTCLARLVPPLAVLTRLVDVRRIGKPALRRSDSLI